VINMAKHARGYRKPARTFAWNPPRKAHVVDLTRVLSIKRNGATFAVINGLGVTLADGFDSNAAALAWLSTHTSRVKGGRSLREASPPARP
jgi:hypothetical protein